tara:strand:+ start:741 stop:1325 length:585 start_codon:yes stop_codon:yes gene_type:complete
VEVAHTNFTKITRVIFIHHDSVVVLTTRHTATGWVLAMFPNSTVTGGDVSTLLAVFVSAGEKKERKKEKSDEICQQVSKTEEERKKKMTHRNRRPESARTRPNSDTPTRIARHKASIARGNVQTSFPNLATERFPPTFAIPSSSPRAFFPLFLGVKIHARARVPLLLRPTRPPLSIPRAIFERGRKPTTTNDDE